MDIDRYVVFQMGHIIMGDNKDNAKILENG